MVGQAECDCSSLALACTNKGLQAIEVGCYDIDCFKSLLLQICMPSTQLPCLPVSNSAVDLQTAKLNFALLQPYWCPTRAPLSRKRISMPTWGCGLRQHGYQVPSCSSV